MSATATEPTLQPGAYASTWNIDHGTEYPAIAKVIREIPDTEPSRDSNDTLWEVQIGRRHYLRRRSELRPLNGKLLKERGD